MKKTYSILLILLFLECSSFLAMEYDQKEPHKVSIKIYDEKTSSTMKNINFRIDNANYQTLKKKFSVSEPSKKICITNAATLQFAYDIVRVAEFFPSERLAKHAWINENLNSINFMDHPESPVTLKNPSHEDVKKDLLYNLYYLKTFQESPVEVQQSAGMFVNSISIVINNPPKATTCDAGGSAANLLKTIKQHSESMPWQLRWKKIGSLDYKFRMFFEKIQSDWKKRSSNNPTTTNAKDRDYDGGKSNEQKSYFSSSMTRIYLSLLWIKQLFLSKNLSSQF